jgi:MFS family permease
VPLRLALFSIPVLLPLLLQIGFGLSPFMSGGLTAAAGIGSLATRGLVGPSIRRFGFRSLMLFGTVATSASFVTYALFRPTTPLALMFTVLLVSGIVGSVCMVSLNTLAYTDVPRARMSHATALASVVQQLTSGGAVVLSGLLLALFSSRRADTDLLLWTDFAATFIALGIVALLSLMSFRRLPADVGNHLH